MFVNPIKDFVLRFVLVRSTGEIMTVSLRRKVDLTSLTSCESGASDTSAVMTMTAYHCLPVV